MVDETNKETKQTRMKPKMKCKMRFPMVVVLNR
jgi:hypothetical protein